MKRSILNILVILFDVSILCAQTTNMPPILADFTNLPSFGVNGVGVADIVKAVLYPVDYVTGLPKVEIPLYEIEFKDGEKLPIKLTYHASGFKPSEAKQRVGIGWTLQAEPQIARSVNGVPDEYYYLPSRDLDVLVNGPNNTNRIRALYNGGAENFQPDHYFYSIMNNSGTFYSRWKSYSDENKNTFMVTPYVPLKIEGGPDTGFNIKDPNGYEYQFTGQNVIARAKYMNYSYTRIEYSTLYKASTIISPLNEVVSFFYEGYTANNSLTRRINGDSYTITIEDPHVYLGASPSPLSDEGTRMDTGECNLNVLKGVWARMKENGMADMNRFQSKVKLKQIFGGERQSFYIWGNQGFNFVEERYFSPPTFYPDGLFNKMEEKYCNLTKIEFEGGVIEFVNKQLVTGEYSVLDYILIKDEQNNIIRKISFTYRNLQSETPRALLTKVSFMDSGNNVEYNYQFDYHSESYLENRVLPSINTNSIDPWGYGFNMDSEQSARLYMPMEYKGQVIEALSPAYQNYEYDLYNKTEVDNLEQVRQNEITGFGERKHLTLNKVTYPTGGYCILHYEPHRFSQYEDFYGSELLYYYYPGGIRIREIQYFDKENNLSAYREYRYGKDGNGSGVPFIKLEGKDFVISENRKYTKVERINALWIDWVEKMDMYSLTYLPVPIINPYYSVGTSTLYEEVSEYYQEMSDPTRNIRTVYKYDLSEIDNVRPYRYTFTENGNNIYSPVVVYMPEQWNIGHLLAVEKWSNGNQLLSKKNYKYEVLSQGNVLPCYIPYSKSSRNYIIDDYDCRYVEGGSYSDSFERNIYFKTHGLIELGVNRVIESHENTDFSMQHYSQKVKLLSEVRDSTDGVITTHVYKYLPDRGLKHTNPIEMTVRGKENSMIQYIEKYQYSGEGNNEFFKRNILNKLLEKQRIVQSSTVFNLKNNYAFFDNGILAANQNNVPETALPGINEISIGRNSSTIESRIKYNRYDKYGNPLYITRDGQQGVVYIWGYKGKYVIAEIKNSTYSAVVEAFRVLGTTIEALAQASAPDMSKLEALQKYSTMKEALITIYTYKPLIGVSSITEPRGMTTYYNYDHMGRLKESYIIENGMHKTLQLHEYNYREN